MPSKRKYIASYTNETPAYKNITAPEPKRRPHRSQKAGKLQLKIEVLGRDGKQQRKQSKHVKRPVNTIKKAGSKKVALSRKPSKSKRSKRDLRKWVL
jgi:hypothetical protein